MGVVYGALARGEAPALPALPVQYVDFAVWQRQWLSGEVLDEQLAWWKEQLAGAPQELDLPTDRPRSGARADQGHRGDRRTLLIPRPLAEWLQAFGQAQGATLFMVLLAAWQTLLGRLSGQDDVVVGSPIANRNRTEIEGRIGCFVNTLVLRTELRGDPAFREVVAAVRRTSLGASAHQDLPFEKIVEELRPERNLARTPLFQVIFTLQNVPSPDMEAAGFRMTLMPPTSRAAPFDLACDLRETAEGVHVSLTYREDLFDGTTVARLGDHYQRLLAAASAHPDQRIGELPFLSEIESWQLLEWGSARETHAASDTLASLFEARARQTPDARAVTCEGGELTYAELNRRASQLAHHLRRLGVGPEIPVGLCAERSLELVVGMVGIVKAGGAYLPLDPAWPAARRAALLADAGARLVIDGREEEGEESGRIRPSGPIRPLSPQNAAYVLYTSGSTGKPKGVVVPHANVVRLLRATERWFGFGPHDVWTLFHSFAFDFSVWEIWGALLSGGRLVVVPQDIARTPEAFHRLLAAERVTVLNQTPTAFAELMRVEGALPDLRLVIFGGEALLPSRLAPWLARYGDARPRLVNMYGITETTVHVTWRPLSAADSGSGSVIGVPIPDLAVYVLDRGGRLAPIGVPGEIHVGGAGPARGYLGRADLTAERFVPDPFADGARLYRSGDLGRFLSTGELEYLGRIDHQVKIRGFRIEPGEIEAALRAHPEVREAVVLARAEESGGGRLVAFVVPGPERLAELRSLLRGTLPEHQVPASFVRLDALPRTGNGKVDRKALLALDETPREDGFVAPRTPIEELIAGIFAEVLKLDAVGAEAHFFELGGHSLLATRVTSRLRHVLGVELPLRALFDEPTVAALARAVRRAQQAEGAAAALPPLVRRPPPRSSADPAPPLSFAQQRLWFLDQLEPGSAAYNIPAGVRLTGALDRAVLAAALDAVVARHEVLRTTFAADPLHAEPVQRIAPPSPLPLPLVDLGGLPEPRREREAGRLAAAAAAQPFDLARGPLLRAELLRHGPAEHVALLTLHHAVADGWSIGVLTAELAALYAAFAAGRPSPLPPLPVQYADFACWQRSWMRGDVLSRQLAFWRQRLAGAPPVLDLPADRPRPASPSGRGGTRTALLPADLAAALRRLGRRQGATPFMLLLAAWKALLHRYTGETDLLVGTPIANRTRTEVEGLIGFFVNTLVLRTGLAAAAPAGPPFAEVVARVRDGALAAYAWQD